MKAIIKEMKTAHVSGRLTGVEESSASGDNDDGRETAAAMWIVDPRSLAEGMSSQAQ